MGGLWAVACYFNPAGFKSRLRNYRVFRQRLEVPLVTVELSYDGSFALNPADADTLLQLRGRDVMWQKERLLNLAIAAVPPECRKIAWLDCDIVFENNDWSRQAADRLDELNLVQLFRRRVNLDQDASPENPRGGEKAAAMSEWIHGLVSREICSMPQALKTGGQTTGLAWAARRDILERHGLYDAAILGSGDRVMANAAFGFFDWGAECTAMNPRQKEHFLNWARPFHQSVAAKVGFIDSLVYHQWHGDLRDRKYKQRHAGFGVFDFDPATDLALDHDRCWKWNSQKHAMYRYVNDYFCSRREDG